MIEREIIRRIRELCWEDFYSRIDRVTYMTSAMLDGATVSCVTGENVDIRVIHDILMKFCFDFTDFCVALRHIADETQPETIEMAGEALHETSWEYYLALIGSDPKAKLDG